MIDEGVVAGMGPRHGHDVTGKSRSVPAICIYMK